MNEETTTTETTAANETAAPETTAANETAPESAAAGNGENDLDAVMLGDAPGKAKAPAEDTPDTSAAAEAAKGGGEEIKIEDYAKNVKLDADLNPKGDNSLDLDALNAVAPVLKECGVKPENANKLVNALARYQLQAALNANKQRFEDNMKAHAVAMQTYTRQELDVISRGIDSVFKPGGVMNFVVRHSEIGNDLEFLALMKTLGSRVPANGGLGAAAGAGSSTVGQSAGYDGIAAAWN